MNSNIGNNRELTELLFIYSIVILVFGFTNVLDKNQLLILLTVVTILYFIVKKLLGIINKPTIEKFNKTNVNEIDSNDLLTYYTQSFVTGLEDIKNIRKVSSKEACLLLDSFLEIGFENGESYLMGFSKGRNKFWEISLDDNNKIEMVRINLNNINIEESKISNIDNVKKSLEVFYKLVGE